MPVCYSSLETVARNGATADTIHMAPWLPIEKIEKVVQPELLFLVLVLVGGAWLVYRYVLGAISPERHRNLRRLFRNLLFWTTYTIALAAIFWIAHFFGDLAIPFQHRVIPTVGLLAILCGCTTIVKTNRILLFEYLFFKNMKVGVPLLIVNLCTLILSIILGGWVLSGIFEFQLAPLLAGSAIFSIVLGLALQDTLGNLIAGVALQFDKPYEIGDWIEVSNDRNKWSGKVEEITWRATVLLSFTEEWIVIPNRVLAQAEISNFSARVRPFIRSLIFRVNYGVPHEKVREVLFKAVAQVPTVRRVPQPLVLVVDTSESWVAFKLIYYIEDYGRHMIIGDEVYRRALEGFAGSEIALARQKLEVITERTLG